MRNYIIKRLLLIPVTLFGILLINFAIIQLAPGGPVEYMLAQYKGINTSTTGNISGGIPNLNEQKYQGAKGVPDDLVKELQNSLVLTSPFTNALSKCLKTICLLTSAKVITKTKPCWN